MTGSPEAATPRPGATRARRWRIAAIVCLALVLAFGAVGYFAGPPLAKRAIENAIFEQLGRKATIGRIAINPYTLRATVEGVAIDDPIAGKPLFAFDALEVKLGWSSVLHRALVLESVRLVKPHVAIVRLADGRYNFADILAKLAAQPKSDAPTPRFSVSNIELIEGGIEFDDRPEQQQHLVDALQIGVPFVSNFPAHTKLKVLPKLTARINGQQFAAEGDTLPFEDSHATRLALRLDKLPIGRYLEYSPIELALRIPAGHLSADLTFEFAQPPNAPQVLAVQGQVDLADVRIEDAAGAPLAEFASLAVRTRRADLTALDIQIQEIALERPVFTVRRDQKGLNFERIVPASKSAAAGPATASERPLRLAIDRISVNEGTLAWNDTSNARPFAMKLTPFSIAVNGFNLPGKEPATLTFKAASEHVDSLEHEGRLTLEPFALEGKLALAGVKPRAFAPYYEHAITADLVAGTAQADLAYRFADGAFSASEVKLGVDNVRLQERATRAQWLALPRAEIVVASLDVAKQAIVIEALTSRGAQIALERAADGRINWSKLAAGEPAGAADKSGRPWRWQVRRVALEDYRIQFADRALEAPVDLPIGPLALTAENLSSVPGTRANVRLSTAIDKSGALAVNGPIVLDPFGASLAVEAKSIDAVRFQPYFADRVNLTLGSGTVTARGKLDLETPPAPAPLLTRFAGDVVVADLATTEKSTAEDLLKWRTLTLSEVAFASEPLALDIRDIALTDFFTRLIVTREGRLNLQSLLVEKEAPASSAASPTDPASAAPAPNIRIGRITLQGGNVQFSDYFIRPNYSANLTGIGGAVSELTPEKPGDVLLRGRVDNSAPLEIAGLVNPLAKTLFLDMKANARDIDLPPVTPYSAKYVGYGIEKGKLSLKLAYKIENQKLEAQNNINLDQLTFGERIESPDALKLPVLLAVALLKDRNGVIDIDLPISGSLDDPQFSIGSLIVRVIVNLITKAITAPFALLGSLFGGANEELGYVEFDAGVARLSEPSESRLQTLARALIDRPGLKLDIAGRIDPQADREGLRRARLEAAIRAQKFNELAKKGAAPAAAEAVTIASEERTRYLQLAYRALPPIKPAPGAKPPPREPSVEDMESAILARIDPTDDDLRALANQRAQAAKDFLLAREIPAERVFVIAPKLALEELKDKGRPTRAEFALH